MTEVRNEVILLGWSQRRMYPTTIILICPALLGGYKYGIIDKMWISVKTAACHLLFKPFHGFYSTISSVWPKIWEEILQWFKSK